MITLIVYFLISLLVLWLLEKIPGLHLIVKPILDAIVKGLHFLFTHGSLWVLWIFKMFLRSHRVFFKNLVTPRRVLNQSEKAHELRKKL